MRRIAVLGALVAVGLVALRGRVPKLHERLMARCEAMFERMPDTFPPKRMLGGIEEIRANTARILDLLETRTGRSDDITAPDTASERGHHAA